MVLSDMFHLSIHLSSQIVKNVLPLEVILQIVATKPHEAVNLVLKI